jgi:hypothetical protein
MLICDDVADRLLTLLFVETLLTSSPLRSPLQVSLTRVAEILTFGRNISAQILSIIWAILKNNLIRQSRPNP